MAELEQVKFKALTIHAVTSDNGPVGAPLANDRLDAIIKTYRSPVYRPNFKFGVFYPESHEYFVGTTSRPSLSSEVDLKTMKVPRGNYGVSRINKWQGRRRELGAVRFGALVGRLSNQFEEMVKNSDIECDPARPIVEVYNLIEYKLQAFGKLALQGNEMAILVPVLGRHVK